MDSRYVERHNAKRGIGSVGEVVGEGQLRQAETENAPAEDGLCVVDLEDDEDGCLDDVEQKARPHGRESADDRLQLAAAVKAPARPSPPPSGKEKEGCPRLHHGLLTLCPPAPGQLRVGGRMPVVAAHMQHGLDCRPGGSQERYKRRLRARASQAQSKRIAVALPPFSRPFVAYTPAKFAPGLVVPSVGAAATVPSGQ